MQSSRSKVAVTSFSEMIEIDVKMFCSKQGRMRILYNFLLESFKAQETFLSKWKWTEDRTSFKLIRNVEKKRWNVQVCIDEIEGLYISLVVFWWRSLCCGLSQSKTNTKFSVFIDLVSNLDGWLQRKQSKMRRVFYTFRWLVLVHPSREKLLSLYT